MATAAAATPLPRLRLDKAQTSVSGLSSGAFMAVQMHVAYSSLFAKGAGVVAGGPFYCAEGSISNATGRCMAHSSAIPVSALVATTRSWASAGSIDPVANLAASKVYLYSGTADNTVKPAVMADLLAYYKSFVPAAAIVYRNDVPSGHAMITDDYGGSCGSTASPFINDCDVDLAGAMLKHFYGALNPRNDGALGGTFSEFDQTTYISGHGMAATGWVYVPQSCTAGAACRLHVVFHGCKQNTAAIGQQYVRNTGYNRWSDSNDIVVLYPQTSAAATNGCWDWWGYDSADYARKTGPQMAAVKAMVETLASNPPASGLPAPTGVAISGATASSMVVSWNAVVGAAGYDVWRDGARITAAPVAGSPYTDGGLAAGTTYQWTVGAVDAAGAEGTRSAPASGTTAGAPSTCTTASNYAHVRDRRAHVRRGHALANGSNQDMGLWNVFVVTTLKKTAPGHFVIGTCP